MKVSNGAMFALLCTATAVPALAQYRSASPPPPSVPQTTSDKAPAEPSSKQIRPSKQALKALIELQKAVTANDVASIPAKLAAANAVATTREDKLIIAQLQLKAAAAANDLASASAAAAAIAASGLMDSANVAQIYRAIGGSSFNAKQYDQAAAAYERAAGLEPASIESLTMLAESRLAQGRKTDAASTFQRAIQASLTAGKKPGESLYKRALQLAYDEHMPAASDLARQWVAAYPSPESWRNAVIIYRNLNQPDADGTLDLLRLMRTAGALTKPSDLALYLRALDSQSNFVEAQNVIDEAKQVDLSDTLVQPLVASLKAKPKATASDLAAAAKNAQSGMALLRIGDRYYGLRDYAKAAEIYGQAKAKAGVDANLANLRLGIALAGAGDSAGAVAAFKSVTGPRSGIAQYWLLYLNTRA